MYDQQKLNDGMRIALIARVWDGIRHRPHHWEQAASARGHKVSVYTVTKPLLKSMLRPHAFQDAHNVRRPSPNFLEMLLWRLVQHKIAMEFRRNRFAQFVQSRVVDKLGSDFDVLIYSSPPFSELEYKRQKSVFIYDCMDEWHNFPGESPEILKWEYKIAQQADLILAVSDVLARRLAEQHGKDKVVVVPNGCDYDFFASASSSTKQTEKTIIGYTGYIREWFDWEVIFAIAKAYPDAIVRLVGSASNVPDQLPRNVEVCGLQPYKSMPSYNATFDVCLIPFRTDLPFIAAVSPIKLYEYLATGRPVVSNPMPDTFDLAEKGILHLANSPAQFVVEIGELLRTSWDPTWIARRQAIAQQHSWTSRWTQVEQHIRENIMHR